MIFEKGKFYILRGQDFSTLEEAETYFKQQKMKKNTINQEPTQMDYLARASETIEKVHAVLFLNDKGVYSNERLDEMLRDAIADLQKLLKNRNTN